MNNSDLVQRLALGAAAGLAATLALQVVRTSTQKLIPEAVPPIRKDPGEFMVEQAEELLPEETRDEIPDTAEAAAAKSLAMGYGMTFGALYGALRDGDSNSVVDGLALGLGVWAIGYLGWLPATELMPPIADQTSEQVATAVLQHALFGLMTTTVYRSLYR
jgi:hypothetical protein